MNPLQRHVPFAALVCFCLAACGGSEQPAPTPTPAQPAAAASGMGDHKHEIEQPLGKMKVGEHEVAVMLLSKIEPGKQVDVDLEFPAGAKLPAVVRGWIGVESGEGSRKAKFHTEGATGMHGHCDVPKTIPAGSKVWVEVEVDGKTTTAGFAY
jgi:acetamidase/formamidase